MTHDTLRGAVDLIVISRGLRSDAQVKSVDYGLAKASMILVLQPMRAVPTVHVSLGSLGTSGLVLRLACLFTAHTHAPF